MPDALVPMTAFTLLAPPLGQRPLPVIEVGGALYPPQRDVTGAPS